MKIRIIAVGKIKEKYLEMAINEYTKRLSRYCSLEIYQVLDEKIQEKMLDKERERIQKYIRDDSFIISLEPEGNMLSSEELAGKIQSLGVEGKSDLTFIIGGSEGLHDEIKKQADFHLSFSKMVFPHQLMRVILLEQLYRSFRIISNEPYHK